MSGVRADRPKLAEVLAFATEGDALTVWKFDRLGRSLRRSAKINSPASLS
jgi:DNA invertase Pin-like site-specific DNA recombinase